MQWAGIGFARVFGAVTYLMIALVMALIVSRSAAAFKVDMHVYIAQVVIDDARDGTVSIQILDKGQKILRTHRLPISERAKRVLRNHPEYYRMGSIGPDAFPSVEVGQMIIHPGVKDGWGTADWLDYLMRSPDLSDQEYAFVLGFLAHAAGDIFAHTYVNRCSGDIFDISTNRTVALRHIMIEAYLSKFLPPITIDGQSKKVHELLMKDGRLAIPRKFIVERMFFDKDAVEQIEKYGKTPYIKQIANLREKLDQLLRDGGEIDKLEQLAIQVALQITLGIDPNNEEAKKIREYSEKIHNFTDFSSELMKLVNESEQYLGDLHKEAKEIFKQAFSSYHEATNVVAAAEQSIRDKTKALRSARDEIDGLRSKIHKFGCKLAPKWVRNACDKIDALAKRVANLDEEIRQLVRDTQARETAVYAAAISAMDIVDKIIDEKLKLNAQLKVFFDRDAAKSPMKLFAEYWRKDIDKSMVAYVDAHGQTIVNTITPGMTDELKPFREWFDCYMKAIVGVPVLVTETACQVRDGVVSLVMMIEEFKLKVAAITPLTKKLYDVKLDIDQKIKSIEEDIVKRGTDEILRDLSRAINLDLLAWKSLLHDNKIDDEILNKEFSTDASKVGLLTFGDIPQRMQSDMDVNVADGLLNPERFSALRNAIVLAKLSLLDQKGLQELAQKEGVRTTIFGDFLYPKGGRTSQNILFGFARVIDGNDHWHILSPPNPRASGSDATGFVKQRDNPAGRYGYVNETQPSRGAASCDRLRGMRMWLDRGARRLLFERLFVAPIVPGIDTPDLRKRKFAPVLHQDYPKTITAEAPWGKDGAEIEMPNDKSDANTTVEKPLKGGGLAGLRVRVTAFGAEAQETNIEDNGEWALKVFFKKWRANECLVVQHLDANGREVLSYLQNYENSLPYPSPQSRVPMPSFSCAGKTDIIKQAICRDVALADKERVKDDIYRMLEHRLRTELRASLRKEEQSWLSRLEACGKIAAREIGDCVAKAYDARLLDLKKYAIQPSFDCKAAKTDVERDVCNSIELSARDQIIEELTNRARSNASAEARTKIEREHRDWLHSLGICSEPGRIRCISRAYTEQLRKLELEPAVKTGQSIWAHNESIVSLYKEGARRQLYYVDPREEIRESGAKSGMLLFEGEQEDEDYSGTAYVFSKYCGPLSYEVSGKASDDGSQITLKGSSKRVNAACEIVTYEHDTLLFRLEEAIGAKK